MKLYEWTPKGRKEVNYKGAEFTQRVIEYLRTIVRETSYNLQMLEAENTPLNEAFSRAIYLRQNAVDILRTFDPNAEDFIKATYQPTTFLHA